jgi:hypothetical protein
LAWTLSLPAAVVNSATRTSSRSRSSPIRTPRSWAAVSCGTFEAKTTVGAVTIRCASGAPVSV